MKSAIIFKIFKILKIFFISCITLILIITVASSCIIFIYKDKIQNCYNQATNLMEGISATEFSDDQTSLVYDKDNNILMKIKGDKENYYLLYNDIPKTVRNAFIAAEDHRFLQHNGVDYISTIRALIQILLNQGELVQGGSTITQQLARNAFLTTDKTFSRKLTEIFLAYQLEKEYEKTDILEFYINNINYGNGCYGIEAASKEYFGCSVSELTSSQMVFLCSIPQNPTYNDPRKYMTNTIRRRDNIIRKMLEYDYITSVEAEQMSKEKITIKYESTGENHNYMETYAKHAATEAIMESVLDFNFQYNLSDNDRIEYEEDYNDAYAKAEQLLQTSGYTIYTSLSLEQQGIIQNNLDELLSSYTSTTADNEYSMQGAVTLIDNETGLVTAIVGGRTPLNHLYTLNRAFQSYRQPGSSIKPLVAYTPYFEDSTHTYSDILYDYVEPTENTVEVPKGTGKNTTILNAVKWSYNAVPWNIVRHLTPENCLQYIKNMSFHKIVDSDNVEAISLGGFTYGVSTLEMASAYSTIQRGGLFIEPSCIVKIVDNLGNIVYSHKNKGFKQIYTEDACKQMLVCLQSVISGGTGTAAKVEGIDVAGKTGTSNDDKDSWFVGFTPYYTAAIWTGHDLPKSEPSMTSNKITATLFSNIMTIIHKSIISSEGVNIKTFDTSNPNENLMSLKVIEEINNNIDSLKNITITNIDNYNYFEQEYNKIEQLLSSSVDILDKNKYNELLDSLENVKRSKWSDILKVTNSMYNANSLNIIDNNTTETNEQTTATNSNLTQNTNIISFNLEQ